jgi:hypothetical protein
VERSVPADQCCANYLIEKIDGASGMPDEEPVMAHLRQRGRSNAADSIGRGRVNRFATITPPPPQEDPRARSAQGPSGRSVARTVIRRMMSG